MSLDTVSMHALVKPPRVANRKQRRKQERELSRERRRRLIDVALYVMRGCQLAFNAEGPLRCGFRSGLCLEGLSWHEADAEAAHIVAVALRIMGCGERPAWDECQPFAGEPSFYPIAHERCVRCGCRLSPTQRDWRRDSASVGTVYCSDICSSAAGADRCRRRAARVRWQEHVARMAAKRRQTESIRLDCDHCGQAFQPAPGRWRVQRFCSVRCADLGKPKTPRTLKPKPCARCGTPFQPRKAVSVFCSSKCRHETGTGAVDLGFVRQCPVCSTIFRVHSRYLVTNCCSRRCANMLRYRGATPAKRADASPLNEGEDDDQGRRVA